MAKRSGLYRKYVVTNLETGEHVNDCFVLRPDRDLLARHVLRNYAKLAGGVLGRELNIWLDAMEDLHDTHK